jgi:hypothetical protein
VSRRGGVVAGVLTVVGALAMGGAHVPGASAHASAGVRDRRCDDRYRDCDQGDDDNYRNVSPGPFEKSPVDAFNDMCMPGATCYYGGTTTTTRPGRRASGIACLVPAPWHCDPRRAAS